MEPGFFKAQSDNLPKIDSLMVASFLGNNNNADFISAEVKGVKAVRSARESYGDAAVGYVQVKGEGSVCTVKAKITPEHKVKKKAYTVILKCNKDEGVVRSVMCEDCAASLVKLAISAGHVIFSLIGDVKNSHYVVVGQPIWDVKAAESKSIAGEIIVSPTAWLHINPTEYLWEEMSDKLHVKVHGVGANWKNIQKNVRYQKMDDDDGGEVDRESKDSNDEVEVQKQGINDGFSLRPSVNVASRRKMKEDLRKFIIAPVMRGIDLDEPLEYLTEMRQVVIVFINVVSHRLDVSEVVNLADKTYKIVCNVVNDMKGCVNKVSLFDKDLMFVVIFGLRGLKHDLESQVALKCAAECQQAISNCREVKSASIGVTTGMTYCGAFGHTLRREYTVISLIVNKAARLMVNYPYKVTCDRETFLHSKMEARNFALQEYKELKGIKQPGPVYEFKEVIITQSMAQTISHFPLLGRDDELGLYSRLLEELMQISKLQRTTFAKLNHHNMIVIYGEARQGKTRLLDEIVYITNPKIPVNRFTVTGKDGKIPYQAIRMFFMAPLGLNEKSSQREWEVCLKEQLKKLKAKDLFCCLNSVFGVRFERSPLFLSLAEREIRVVVKKFIKQLFYRCFLTNWVVAIDDGEFIDEESWDLLEGTLDFDKIFVVLTVGQRKNLGPAAETVLDHRKIRKITLKSIDKWFHAGLACQILDVYAIPPELEKVIQTRSNGNPGWVESYLVSLIQAGGLVVKQVDRTKVADLGLVTPPLYMLFRLTKEQVEKWKTYVEQTVGTHIDDWKMYIDCYKDDSETNLPGNQDVIPVCTLSPQFNVGDVDQELSMDVMILKTFDSLTSYEQMLLKSSSILGDCFLRDMLLYIMSCSSKRKASLAVQKLFEIRVLSCARGDFTDEGAAMIFKERLINPDYDIGIKCGCLGLLVDDDCHDLPKYASCGYLRFRSSMFRETTYSLLTEKQKKEFHSRAVRYLEKETRRCRACGYGFFPYFLGARKGGGLQKPKEQKKAEAVKDEYSTGKSRAASTARKESIMATLGTSQATAIMYGVAEEGFIPFSDTATMGFMTVNRLKNSYSLTKTFSSFDFADCECLYILITVYSQMIHHCKGAGIVDQMIDAMIECSNLCIITENTPQAKYILKKAYAAVEQRSKEPDLTDWKVPILKGRIYTLLGVTYDKLGQEKVAIRYLFEAMVLFETPFPTGKLAMKMRKIKYDLKRNMNMFVFNEMVGEVSDRYQANFCENVSDCLAQLCKHFMKKDKWEEAELAAAWGLSLSLKTGSDFKGICIAFANMILVSHHKHKVKTCVALEVNSMRICHRKRHDIQVTELVAVANLYNTITQTRYARGELDKAVYIGHVMLAICQQTYSVLLMLRLLPILTQALIQQKHIVEAVSKIMELQYYGNDDKDTSGLMWYYSMCICLQMECGYEALPFKMCQLFHHTRGEYMPRLRDIDVEKRYYTTIWLCNMRMENWEDVDLWFSHAMKYKEVKADDSVNNLFTALYLLEGLILYMVSKSDKRNVKKATWAHSEIMQLTRRLEVAAQHSCCIRPRLRHLIAYFNIVMGREIRGFALLKQAKKLANQYGNELEVAWMEHNWKAWNRGLTPAIFNMWKTRSQQETLMDYHEFEMNGGKLCFFTLSPPQYI